MSSGSIRAAVNPDNPDPTIKTSVFLISSIYSKITFMEIFVKDK